MMRKIHHITGDATKPTSTPAILLYVCNDVGKEYSSALTKRYPQAERAYKSLMAQRHFGRNNATGEVQFVSISEKIVIANMLTQKDLKPHRNHLDNCFFLLAERALHADIIPSIHTHKSWLGPAGSWDKIESLITKNLSDKDIEVFVYDLKKPVHHNPK